MIVITLHQLLLLGIFLYVAIGAAHAMCCMAVSKGFTGEYDLRMTTALFFFWLPLQIMRVPWLAFIILVLGIAAGVCSLVSLVLP